MPSSRSSTESLIEDGVGVTGGAMGDSSGGVIALGPFCRLGAGTVTDIGRRLDPGGETDLGPSPGSVVG